MISTVTLRVCILVTIINSCTGALHRLEVDRFNGPLFNDTCAFVQAEGTVPPQSIRTEHVILLQEAMWGPPTKLADYKGEHHAIVHSETFGKIVSGLRVHIFARKSALYLGITKLAACLTGSFSYYDKSDDNNHEPSGNIEYRSTPPNFDVINFTRPDVLFGFIEYLNDTLKSINSKLPRMKSAILGRQQVNDRLKLLQGRILPTMCEKGVSGLGKYSVVAVPGKRDILCDTETDNGGWIVFQRRVNGLEEFFTNWTAYKNGFGSFKGDFWMGNDWLSETTNTDVSTTSWEIRVDAVFGRKRLFGVNWPFSVGSEATKYKLHLGGHHYGETDNMVGNHTGEDYVIHNMMFSTSNRDNDRSPTNCALVYGAWWHNMCAKLTPNGLWREKIDGIYWHTYTGFDKSLDQIELKIRRRDEPTPLVYRHN